MKATLKHTIDAYVFTKENLDSKTEMEGIPDWLYGWPKYNGYGWYVNDSNGEEVPICLGDVAISNKFLNFEDFGQKADYGEDFPWVILFDKDKFKEAFKIEENVD